MPASDDFLRKRVHGNAASRLVPTVLRNEGTAALHADSTFNIWVTWGQSSSFSSLETREEGGMRLSCNTSTR